MDDHQFSLFGVRPTSAVWPNGVLSWNVNGVLPRISLVHRMIERYRPDVVCLQEVRVDNNDFPSDSLEELGYEVFLNSAGGRNGVATLTKVVGRPSSNQVDARLFNDGRALLFVATEYAILNIYAPNAAFADSPAYANKLEWLRCLYRTARSLRSSFASVAIVGDFNVAPTEAAIHGECRTLYPAFLTRELTAAWQSLIALGYAAISPTGSEPHYTWWSYKDRGFERNVGMQIDHVLLSGFFAEGSHLEIVRTARQDPGASDHAPLMASLGRPRL